VSGRVPIIALSASAMKDETEQCMAAGMIGHLPKPIDPVALAATLSLAAEGAAPPAAPPPSTAQCPTLARRRCD
jgi:CheY-like chemotaxis protein